MMPTAGRLALLAGLAIGAAMPAVAQASPPGTAPTVSDTRTAADRSAAPDEMTAGQLAFDSKDYDKAYGIWIKLAERGYDPAAMMVAGMLDQGVGIRRDSAAALRWYVTTAEHGVPTAELNAGILLDSGRGAPRDAAKAATWYARAATHGNRRAQYNLGQLYAAGEGVPLNPAAAQAWFGLAAHNGVQAATAKLAAGLSAGPPTQLAPASDLRQVVMQAPLPDKPGTATPAGDVEFVWLAPAQPVPVIFYVEVAAVDGQSTHPATSRYVAETAVSLDLGKTSAVATSKEYIWRVYVVDQRRQRYVTAGWKRFSVAESLTPRD